MSYIEKSLSKDEQVKEIFKYHGIIWVAAWLWIAIFVALGVVTFGLSILGAIYVFFRIKSVEQGLTTKRIIRKTGVISRKTEEMKNSAVETVEINQSVFGRIFGYGIVKVTGTGTSSLKLNYVKDPLEVKKRIEEIQD